MPNEQVTKKDIQPAYPAVRTYDNKKAFIAKTGAFKGASVRYEIVWDVPATDEEAKERYDVSLSDLIMLGVQIISHRPAYNAIFDGVDIYNADKHKDCQKLADAYKPGQRVVGQGAVTKAQAALGREVQASMQALGFSTVEELMEAVAKSKGKAKK